MGGCNPLASASLTSCMPEPVCENANVRPSLSLFSGARPLCRCSPCPCTFCSPRTNTPARCEGLHAVFALCAACIALRDGLHARSAWLDSILANGIRIMFVSLVARGRAHGSISANLAESLLTFRGAIESHLLRYAPSYGHHAPPAAKDIPVLLQQICGAFAEGFRS